MNISEYFAMGTFAIGTIGAAMVVLTYRRAKRQELENQLYRLKLDALANCTYYMEKYLIEFEATVYYLKKLASGKEKFDKDYLDRHTAGLEKTTYESCSQVLMHTVYFRSDVIVAAKDFVHNVLFDFPDVLPDDNEECIDLMDSHYKEQIHRGNKVNDLMRASLNLERIDQSLFKRGK
jgi:hypothetical protein